MPRKRTVQPQPIETLHFEGVIADVYADDAQPIGRGLNRKHKSIARRDQAMSYLADLYLSNNPQDTARLNRCLRNASYLQLQLDNRGMVGGSRAVWQSANDAARLFKALSPHMKKTTR